MITLRRYGKITLWLAFACCHGVSGWAQEGAEAAAELSQEEQEIRAGLQDVGFRIRQLSNKLQATDPDDATRMRAAADRIHGSDLGKALEEISALLRRANFVEALGRQDKALEELDSILEILERTKFEQAEDLEKKANELAALEKQAAQLATRQSSLLDKTKEFLDRLRAVAQMKDLSKDVADLKKSQSDLQSSQGSDKPQSETASADQKALESARDLAQRLLDRQKQLNGDLKKAPGESRPLEELRSLVEAMERLLHEGESVAQRQEALSAKPSGAERSAPPSPDASKSSPPESNPTAEGAEGAKGSVSKDGGAQEKDAGATKHPKAEAEGAERGAVSKSAPVKPAESKEGSPSGSDSTGAESKGDKPQGDVAKDGQPKSSTDGAQPAGDNGSAPKERSPSDDGVAKSGDGKPSTTRSPDSGQAKKPADQKSQDGAAPKDGSSAAQESPGDVAKASQEFAEKLNKFAGEATSSKATPQAGKESLQRSADKAREASQDTASRDFAGASKAQQQSLGELRKARDAVAKELQSQEEANTGETASLVQEQGLLEKETRTGSDSMQKASQGAEGGTAQSSLEEGSQSLTEAAKSMESAAKAQRGGDRQGAKEAAERAEKQLAKAEAGLSKAAEAERAKSPEEKAAELQKKLARKAEEARKKADELRKKLAAKSPDGGKLGDAEKSLGEAAQAMDEAAAAREKGNTELAKKKSGEALERLDRAQAALDEEREQLERMEKEKVKKSAPEQDELARMTKDLAKKASASQSSSSSSGDSQDLDSAAEDMEQAAENLSQEDAERAKQEQEEALKKLNNKREELKEEKERLAQLKREQEMLSMVEALTEIKTGQEKVNTETASIDAGREANESRRQRLKISQTVEKLVTQQGELAEQVDGLNQKLKEELARVFLFVLKNVSADMRQVRDSLKELDTGTYTQFLQKEIVRDVERLITTLKEEMDREQEMNEPQQGQSPGPQPEPLVPRVAELRMLKAMQLDVNKGTRDLEDLRKASKEGVTESWGRALDRLLQKQGSVSRMTGEILKEFQQAAKGEEDATPHEPGAEGQDEKPQHE